MQVIHNCNTQKMQKTPAHTEFTHACSYIYARLSQGFSVVIRRSLKGTIITDMMQTITR